MKSTFLSGLRSLFAVVAGFLVIALGTTLTFEVWLGGIGFHKSGPTELALATVGALASGLAGGLVAALVAGRRPLLHAAALLVPIHPRYRKHHCLTVYFRWTGTVGRG